jgi:hypothetical protein
MIALIARTFEHADRHFPHPEIVGIVTTVGAANLSQLEAINLALRIAMDVIGLSIGILTLVITWRKFRRD